MTTTVSVRLREDQEKFVRDFGINLSERVRDMIDEEFLNSGFLDNYIKEYQDKIDKLEKEKERLQCITDEEKQFLLESDESIKRNSDYVYGRIRRYINEFKKPCPSVDYFKKLIKKARDMK